ncbi:cation:proton antiporter [Pseudoalteromonas sp. MMG024]|uniref:cation:proton antiporter domain-containing protein n=1 Tax=Pseudoalteromonas sp. MMG024 TaxID=2909980 RepID=UPI001F00A3F4|nr:cation:proton antiporter [Pseudoalteromonas sp. MMG024]MCF6458237.1 cation:proton antiporter [Pseudoalteromonas sp. MMG024]
MQHTFGVYFYILIAAVVLIWLFKRFNLPPILAYLAVGILAGKDGFAWLEQSEQMHFIAELGIVFLLFSLGLEFSIPRLLAMRHIVFGVGVMQVVITTLVVMVLLWVFGISMIAAFSIGSLVALSSTAIVVKQVSGSPLLRSRPGQLAIGVLLFQDIAVVPLLIALPLLANGSESFWTTILTALAKGGVVIALLMAVGKWVLPRVFSEIAQTRSDELFVLTTILVALIAAALTSAFGLSMALGAFLAGMMLGESEYKHQLEADIRPFRDILMGLFFITIGMQLDMAFVVTNLQWIALGLFGLLTLKVAITYFVTKMAGENHENALASALMLCQMGEFSFVLISLALKYALLNSANASLLLSVGVLSMAITPYLVDNGALLSYKILNKVAPNLLTKNSQSYDNGDAQFDEFSQHVVICGYGRVGQIIARFLKTEAIPFVAIDSDTVRVKEAQAAGENIYFGQAKQKEVLKGANIAKSRLVIITFADKDSAFAIINSIKQLAPKVKILVRMRDDRYLSELKDKGVTEVVPEKLEASLMLVSHVLFLTGVPMRRILRRVQAERSNRYGLLHGYFPGDSTPLSPDSSDHLEFLHAIAITEDAYARGLSLGDLNLTKRRVDVTGLRRDGNELSFPPSDTVLKAQDILIVRGKPRRVERAERFILEGR